jgi:hypothetical protein
MFYYNHGLGFTIDAVNPIIREAQGLKPLEHNMNFDDKLPF